MLIILIWRALSCSSQSRVRAQDGPRTFRQSIGSEAQKISPLVLAAVSAIESSGY